MTTESSGNLLDEMKSKLPEMKAEYKDVFKKLSQYLEENDKTEVIAQFLMMSAFAPEDNPSFNSEYRESSPMIHCLSGLALNSAKENPDSFDSSNFMAFVEDIQTLISKHHFLMMVESNRLTPADDVAHTARLQAIMGQMNLHAYQFQIDRLLDEVYRPFDQLFLSSFGFSIEFAVKCAKTFRSMYEERVNDQKLDSQKFISDLRSDPKAIEKAENQAREYNCTPEDVFISWGVQVHFFRLRECFLLTADNLSQSADVPKEQAGAFLNFFSCEYGENNGQYLNLESSNIILKKPIIKTSGGWFCPLLNELYGFLPRRFDEAIIKIGGAEQERIKELKTKHSEDLTFSLLKSIFGVSNCFQNVHYSDQVATGEVDVLVLFDNRLISIEVKSGRITDRAHKGKIDRLETDLGKIVGDSFEQSVKFQEFLERNRGKARLFNGVGKGIITITGSKDDYIYHSISVSLEALLMFAASPQSLKAIGLFKDSNQYPWVVQLSELECVLQRFSSPLVFIHYLESRQRAMQEDAFKSFDELSLLGFYLKHGNFYVPIEEGRKVSMVMVTEFVRDFDDHYLLGKEAPELEIEPEYTHMIQFLEREKPNGYTSIGCALLDVPRNERGRTLKHLHKMIEMTKKDGKPHTFAAVFPEEELSLGLTLITYPQRKGLVQHLFAYSELKKYQLKTKRWIGLGVDVSDEDHLINEYFFHDSEWKHDPHFERLVKEWGLKPMGKVPPTGDFNP